MSVTFGASRTHFRESLVAGSVDEGNLATVLVDLVRADVLSDSTSFGLGDDVSRIRSSSDVLPWST